MRKEKTESAPGRASRRRFTKTLAAAVIAAPALTSTSSGQVPPAAKEPKAPPNPQPASAAQAQAAPKPSPVAEAYAEVARARFGERLSPEQLEAVKRDLEGNVRAAERLRVFKLQNSDEPDFVFGA
jgi:cell division septation protein DedD